jgi:hypothetical protein
LSFGDRALRVVAEDAQPPALQGDVTRTELKERRPVADQEHTLRARLELS